jgi:hypothetical protein
MSGEARPGLAEGVQDLAPLARQARDDEREPERRSQQEHDRKRQLKSGPIAERAIIDGKAQRSGRDFAPHLPAAINPSARKLAPSRQRIVNHTAKETAQSRDLAQARLGVATILSVHLSPSWDRR